MKIFRLLFILFVPCLIFQTAVRGQDLDSLLNAEMSEEVHYATATFKATRIINGHSIERMPEGQLDFRISHRFGTLNSGAYELFGLDQSTIHFSLEYGIFDWLMMGVGRGSFEKTFDGFTKLSLLRQSSGKRNMPVFLTVFSSIELNSTKWSNPDRENYFYSRLSYVQQVLIGRKFSNSFSLQISPTMVHRNLVPTELDPNDLFALGVGGRLKLTTRVSLNAEYFYVVRPLEQRTETIYINPLSIGFDIETGGHVFQIMFTNSLGMREGTFIGKTTGDFFDGDIHLGFNISRVFTLKR